MHSLKDVVDALRREIAAALEENQPLPKGTRLEAERVVATLQFCIEENDTEPSTPAFRVVTGVETKKTSASPMHSLTIEFKCGSSEGGGTKISPEIAASTPSATSHSTDLKLSGAEAKRVTEQLATVFGAPGFDSAARATVFREALETLSDAEVTTLLAALRGTPVGEKHATVKRAMALLQRVCHSGPSGVEKGKATLAELFSRHPVKSLVTLVGAVWKSQQDWMS